VETETRRELEAAVAAREELGPEHEEHLVAGFVDRIEREIERRVDERLATRLPARRRGTALHPANLALCIPIVAVAGGVGGPVAAVVAIVALALVFIYAERERNR
jgi:hypothetical protein